MKHNDLLEKVINDPSAFKIAVVGSKERYDANKFLFGQNYKYYPSSPTDAQLAHDGMDLMVICGEPAARDITIPVFHVSDLISFKAAQFWDRKQEYIGVDLNHHASNPHFMALRKNYGNPMEPTSLIQKLFSDKQMGSIKKPTCLSIGCGCGAYDRMLAKLDIFDQIHGCDVSEESLAVARQKAEEEGLKNISYFSHDCSTTPFAEQYDFIFVVSCTHHIERLENFFQNVKDALKPGGYFMQKEYTGAARFEHNRRYILTINTILSLLKKKYMEKKYKVSPTAKFADPSEGVRADEIIPLSKHYFPDTKIYPYYEGILHAAYQCVRAKKFHTNPKRSRKLYAICYFAERIGVALRFLPISNALILSKKS